MRLLTAVCLVVAWSPLSVLSLSEDEQRMFINYKVSILNDDKIVDDKLVTNMIINSELESLSVPGRPKHAEEKHCLYDGVIGIAVNGVPILSPYDERGYSVASEQCTDQDVAYRGIPECLIDPEDPDKLVGVAADGYPIYGPYDKQGKEIDSADLDECMGNFEMVIGPDGEELEVYRYRATKTFPYTIGCFSGVLHEDYLSSHDENDLCLDPTQCGESPGDLTPGDAQYKDCGGDKWKRPSSQQTRHSDDGDDDHEAEERELQEIFERQMAESDLLEEVRRSELTEEEDVEDDSLVLEDEEEDDVKKSEVDDAQQYGQEDESQLDQLVDAMKKSLATDSQQYGNENGSQLAEAKKSQVDESQVADDDDETAKLKKSLVDLLSEWTAGQ